ncbi:MAG: HD domain-containing protein [Halobacteriovoraceae bacterium]|nr:HD domain-containing protein [Halobacteriovoraceae bacterium]MCB9095140.1 HD domain-containing protein [Halobacteriovoraceae bacterium]
MSSEKAAPAILICNPDSKTSSEISKCLKENNYSTVQVHNGIEAQIKMSKQKFHTVILDMDTQKHTAFEVIRYIKFNSPSSRIIFTYENQKLMDELNSDNDFAFKLGIHFVMKRPLDFKALLNNIESNNLAQSWKNVKKIADVVNETEKSIQDEEFTRIAINQYAHSELAIFDLYLRIGQNRYLKILYKGCSFDNNKIEEYQKKKVEFLYFKTKDRGIYINFVNNLIEKYLDQGKINKRELLNLNKGLVEKYVEEIFFKGLNPELYEEGKKLAENLYRTIKASKSLGRYLDQFEEEEKNGTSYIFVTSIFAGAITHQLEWAGPVAHKYVIEGSLLHDIGKIKLSEDVRYTKLESMTPEQFKEYKEHPLWGMQMLAESSFISEQVRQITYQHHEWVNGEGFPNGLFGLRIFPLAKIVSLAGDFSEFIHEKKVSPLVAIKEFIADRETIFRYDSSCIKSLITSFIY